jgi:hypothetical protein
MTAADSTRGWRQVTRPRKQDLPQTTANVGKRVGGSLYVHRDALSLLGTLATRVLDAEKIAENQDWNVAKIEKASVSLLIYESFDADFPALLVSTKVVLPSGPVTRTDYRRRANPPILHRKELLLAPHDPRLPQFRALTAAAEDHGLFKNPNRIGTRAAWNALITQAGLVLRNRRFHSANDKMVEVARHRTAIVRRDLSQPMQLMMRLEIVSQSRTLFDYGCGQGEDIAALSSQGFTAFGWDQHHAVGGQRQPADIVNLGFVLNVIEDPHERLETLKAAWGFAQQALCVAVIRPSKVSTTAQQRHRAVHEAAAGHPVEFLNAGDDARRRGTLARQAFESEGAAPASADRSRRSGVFFDDAVPLMAGVAAPLPTIGDRATVLADESRTGFGHGRSTTPTAEACRGPPPTASRLRGRRRAPTPFVTAHFESSTFLRSWPLYRERMLTPARQV